jgi:hypothetical protein
MPQKVVTNDEAVTGRYMTNLRGTFVENVKKQSKINPPYCTVLNASQGKKAHFV